MNLMLTWSLIICVIIYVFSSMNVKRLTTLMIYWNLAAIPLHIMINVFIYVQLLITYWIFIELSFILITKCLIALNFIRHLEISYKSSMLKETEISVRLLYCTFITCMSPFIMTYSSNRNDNYISMTLLLLFEITSMLAMVT
eukprot:46242_1